MRIISGGIFEAGFSDSILQMWVKGQTIIVHAVVLCRCGHADLAGAMTFDTLLKQ